MQTTNPQNVNGGFRLPKRSVIIAGMDWEVIFCHYEKGNEPVKDFILGQPDGAIAEILHVLKLLRQFNITLGMPYVRKIDKSGLRELRIKHGSDIFRIFLFAYTGEKVHIATCYSQKGRQNTRK